MNILQRLAIAFAFAVAASYVGDRINARYKVHVAFRVLGAILFSAIFILLLDPPVAGAVILFGIIMYSAFKKPKLPKALTAE